MSGDISPYTALITSEHNQQPNYMAMIAATMQPFADGIDILKSIPGSFDLDTAVGQQLDYTGKWIGAGRVIQVAVPTLFFKFDTSGQGFDQAIWWDGSGSLTVSYTLDDDTYRLLLYSKAAANSWNGSIPDAYRAWNILFQGVYTIKIYDNGDMTMKMELDGPTPSSVTKAMFENGYLDLRPDGVRITEYLINGV